MAQNGDAAMCEIDAGGACNPPSSLKGGEEHSLAGHQDVKDADQGSGSRRTSRRTAKTLAESKSQAPDSRKANESPGDVLFVYPLKSPDGGQRTRGADTVTVTRGDLNTLADEELLNDTVMDFYIKYLEANLKAAQREECHFFSTFFWKRLSQEQNPEARHAGVAKWTRKVDIFSKRFLFVPICDSLHWTLAILCRPAGVAELDNHEEIDTETVGERWGRERKDLHITLYLDSLGGYKKEAIERLGDYLRMEWRIKKGSQIVPLGGGEQGAGVEGGEKGKGKDGNEKEQGEGRGGGGGGMCGIGGEEPEVKRLGRIFAKAVPVPNQSNSCDCGVFVLEYIEKFLQDFLAGGKLYAEWEDKDSRKWFPTPDKKIKQKRKDMRKLIDKLAQEYRELHGPSQPAASDKISAPHSANSQAPDEDSEPQPPPPPPSHPPVEPYAVRTSAAAAPLEHQVSGDASVDPLLEDAEDDEDDEVVADSQGEP
jgi:hypothetical protein